jgi:hypothetical protein
MASDQYLPDATQISAAPEQLCSNIRDEAVILDLKSGNYYGLNPVGAYIWQLIQASTTVGEIKTAILNEFEVDEATCSHDLERVLSDLANQGLIEVRHEKAP